MNSFHHVRVALIAALSIAAASPVAAARHDIHIGYCRAVVLPTVLSGKVTYYKDDFFAALRQHQEQHQQKRIDFYSYLNQHLQLQEGGRAIPLIVDQYGQDESTIWFTFKFYFNHSSQSLRLTHSSLTDLYSDQLNITNVTGLAETSGTLSASQPSLQLDIPH
ncbi:MAG: hypothetical protein IT211_13730 [Armatimonadetes bacterium]|nr:hypothetical protein [Armatimonadota bacterium]